jgi:mannose-6-phosphate isomerase-like protein (cupin superfamily)
MAHWMELPDEGIEAPDGSQVRPLWRVEPHGSMAHFELFPRQVSRAVRHRRVHELWFVVAGSGQMVVGDDAPFPLHAGVSVHVPPRTRFQIRAGSDGLRVVGVTMPPWPDEGDAEPAPSHWDV